MRQCTEIFITKNVARGIVYYRIHFHMERGFGRIPNHVERQRWLADNCLAKGQEFYDRVLRQKTEGNIPQTGATVDESD
jgi:hypothetical protein